MIDVDDKRGTSWSARDTRRHERNAVLWSAKLYREGTLHDCTVLNISAGGAKVHLQRSTLLATTAIVTLTILRYGDFQGEVMWERGDRVGLQFFQPAEQVARRLATPQAVLAPAAAMDWPVEATTPGGLVLARPGDLTSDLDDL